MTDSSQKQADYESIEDLFDEQDAESDESGDPGISSQDNYSPVEDLLDEQVEVSGEFISNGDSLDKIEDLFDDRTEEPEKFEDVSISCCVYEPVLVGLQEEKLESRLEKSFYPGDDLEINAVDKEGNSLIIPIADIQFLAFVNLPLQIDLLKVNDLAEVVETFHGGSFEVRIPDGQDFVTGFFGLIENPVDRYKYFFFPNDNIRTRYQQRPIGDIFVEKNILSKDILENVLRKQTKLRNLRLGSIIAKRASLQPQHIEKTLQDAWQKRPDKKLQLEAERLNKEAVKWLQNGKKRLQEEADRKLQLEEERLKKEAEERLLQKKEELLKEAEEKRKTEEEKLKKEMEERLSQARDEFMKELDRKLQLEEERLKKEADEKLLQQENELLRESEEKKKTEGERLKKEIDARLTQEQAELQKEVEERKKAEKERLKDEIEEKSLREKERLQDLANKKLQLEAEWLKTAPAEKTPTGDVLIEAGLVSPQVVKQSLAIQNRMRKMKLGEMFIEMGLIDEEQMCKVLAEKFKRRFVNLHNVTPTDEALRCLPLNFLKKMEAVPIHFKNERLVIATSDPDKGNLIDTLQEKLTCPFELVVSPRNQIIEILANLHD